MKLRNQYTKQEIDSQYLYETYDILGNHNGWKELFSEERGSVMIVGEKHYRMYNGWEEVSTETWVDVTKECYIDSRGDIYHNGDNIFTGNGYRCNLIDDCGTKRRMMIEKKVKG